MNLKCCIIPVIEDTVPIHILRLAGAAGDLTLKWQDLHVVTGTSFSQAVPFHPATTADDSFASPKSL